MSSEQVKTEIRVYRVNVKKTKDNRYFLHEFTPRRKKQAKRNGNKFVFDEYDEFVRHKAEHTIIAKNRNITGAVLYIVDDPLRPKPFLGVSFYSALEKGFSVKEGIRWAKKRVIDEIKRKLDDNPALYYLMDIGLIPEIDPDIIHQKRRQRALHV